MSTVDRLYNFQAGQKIFSQQVDDEFNQLVTAHNTNDARTAVLEDKFTYEVATQEYVDEQITQAMLGNPPLGGVTKEMLDPGIQWSLDQADKGMANLAVLAEINGISTGQSGYGYDLFRGAANNLYSAAKMDTTRANVAATIAPGTTSVTISNLEGGSFLIGQEVTLQDVVNEATRERKIIQNVVGSVVAFTTGVANTYSANAKIYRSLGTIDAANKKLKFAPATYLGGTITAATYTISASQNLETSGSANARRLVRTARGWLVHVVTLSATSHNLYISKDGGVTWSLLCSNSYTYNPSGELGVWGDTVYWVMGGFGTSIVMWKIDTLNQSSGDIKNNAIQVTPRKGYGNPSMAIDSKGFIHVSSPTGGIGDNLYVYCLSKDGGNTFTEQSVVMNSGYTAHNTLLIDKNDNPIFFTSDGSSPYNVVYTSKVNGVFQSGYISGASGGSGGMSAIVKRSGSNIGRIILVSNSTGAFHYSDDNGATWTGGGTITIGIVNKTAQLTENSNGDVYLVAHQTSVDISTNRLPNGSTTWSSYSNYDTTTSSDTVISTLEYATFTVPVVAYGKSSVGTVLRGTYTPILVKDLTQMDVRYNIVPPTGLMDELRSWITYEEYPGFTVTSAFSSVNAGAGEVFNAMTAENTDYGSVIETYFEGSVPTAKARNTQRITMNRAFTSEDRTVNKYLAALIAP